jgi:hypothetical protein
VFAQREKYYFLSSFISLFLFIILYTLLVRRSRDRSPVVLLGIFSEATDGTMCPGVDSASENEYQENSWE